MPPSVVKVLTRKTGHKDHAKVPRADILSGHWQDVGDKGQEDRPDNQRVDGVAPLALSARIKHEANYTHVRPPGQAHVPASGPNVRRGGKQQGDEVVVTERLYNRPSSISYSAILGENIRHTYGKKLAIEPWN